MIAPVGIAIRRQLVETLEKRPQDRARGAPAILSAVIRSNWRGVLLGLALISGGTITQYFLITMTPYAIRTLHLPPSSAMLGAITLGITGCLGALAGGALADRWGIRPVVIASRIGLMIVLFPVMKFLVANPSATTLVLAITILSLLHAAGVAVIVALIPLIFPPGIRSTGLALTYAAWRRDLWRHGDLRRHVAGRRNRGPAGFDLLCDGGERGVAPGRARDSKFRHDSRRLAAVL